MSVKNVSHDLTIEVVENINQTFCGGQVAGVKYIISYHIYNNGKYNKEYSVFKYKHLHQTTDTTDHRPEPANATAFLKTFFFNLRLKKSMRFSCLLAPQLHLI